MIKKIVPKNIKIRIHLVKNWMRDVSKGYLLNFAKKRPLEVEKLNIHAVSITQDLKSNKAKEKNIDIARNHVNSTIIYPGEIFSFWRVIGNPIAKRGFVKSRSLINGEVIESYGGGLCQLSGLIYLSSLYGGLEILERHSHSLDIYTEETRYMPLGGDATVAYGYKDLKIKNTLSNPINFNITFEEDKVKIDLRHTKNITLNEVDFKVKNIGVKSVEVVTFINDETFTTSTYKKLEA